MIFRRTTNLNTKNEARIPKLNFNTSIGVLLMKNLVKRIVCLRNQKLLLNMLRTFHLIGMDLGFLPFKLLKHKTKILTIQTHFTTLIIFIRLQLQSSKFVIKTMKK